MTMMQQPLRVRLSSLSAGATTVTVTDLDALGAVTVLWRLPVARRAQAAHDNADPAGPPVTAAAASEAPGQVPPPRGPAADPAAAPGPARSGLP